MSTLSTDEVSQYEKDLVEGYIRMSTEELSLPLSLILLCLQFFVCFDEWDNTTQSKGYFKLLNKRVVARIKSQMADGYSDTIFLKNIVNKGIHIWRFKIVKKEGDGYMKVGFWKARLGNKLTEAGDYCNARIGYFARHMSGYPHAYAFSPYFSRINSTIYRWNQWPEPELDMFKHSRRYGATKKGDIIELCLDCNAWTISFGVVGKFREIAFKNIEKTEYRAALTLDRQGMEIKLLSYLAFG